ncbi:hypothetical protein [Rhizobium sp. RU36D]|uniref:hypothetical protein n=1 Tax=Rhizobium sp. RU36D TaxID=1907415 RepID=UPI0009D8911F|nr:hypothetical protein [Rhizobium sp. RU36D]SMD20331.1 hypothetical protein SAMN05880593_1533 [Rhizobium sp. RU36D]
MRAMGRPPLYMQRTSLNLDPGDLARTAEIVGEKGISKFVRDAMREKLARLAPTPAETSGDIFEHDGGHEPRLSAAGTDALMSVIAKKGFDQVMASLGYTDHRAFLHMLLGHSELPNEVVTAVAQLVIHRRAGT